MASTSVENQILTEENLHSRTIILNRPRQLNALSKFMISQIQELYLKWENDDNVNLVIIKISQIQELYLKWENDDNVNLVIIKGIGRAFCSGGDVAEIYRLGNAGIACLYRDRSECFIHWSTSKTLRRHGFYVCFPILSQGSIVFKGNYSRPAYYFWIEYIMNYILGTYRKPQVALLNGIVMGGGAGISMHGKFRVATENTLFAMPETGLGLHPDVGASYFLSRLPGFLGEYVGLTGVRLNGAELLACGLATHFVHSMRLPLLEKTLARVETADPNIISSVIDGLSDKVPVKDGSALQRLEIIEKCFSKETVEDIISALELEAKCVTDQWLKSSIQSMKKASPVSLKISLRSIREGRRQQLHECLVREYRMTCHVFLRKISSDFYEGCRAILVDKDRNPKWRPDKLEHVSQDMVDHYFSPIGEGLKDLELPIYQRESSTHSPVQSKL